MKMLFSIILMMFSGLISSQNSGTFKVSRLKISKFDGDCITINSKVVQLEN
jgi:hypothetical protein